MRNEVTVSSVILHFDSIPWFIKEARGQNKADGDPSLCESNTKKATAEDEMVQASQTSPKRNAGTLF